MQVSKESVSQAHGRTLAVARSPSIQESNFPPTLEAKSNKVGDMVCDSKRVCCLLDCTDARKGSQGHNPPPQGHREKGLHEMVRADTEDITHVNASHTGSAAPPAPQSSQIERANSEPGHSVYSVMAWKKTLDRKRKLSSMSTPLPEMNPGTNTTRSTTFDRHFGGPGQRNLLPDVPMHRTASKRRRLGTRADDDDQTSLERPRPIPTPINEPRASAMKEEVEPDDDDVTIIGSRTLVQQPAPHSHVHHQSAFALRVKNEYATMLGNLWEDFPAVENSAHALHIIRHDMPAAAKRGNLARLRNMFGRVRAMLALQGP